MPVHRHLDDDLRTLRDRVFRMADLVDEQLGDALDALLRQDEALGARVFRRDDEVDALELEIDKLCERILALHQPVAAELRAIITAVKVNTDLERIGDHCKNIAKNVPRVAQATAAIEATQLQEMGDLARAMLRDVQEAYARGDRSLAQRIVAQDDRVDHLHRRNFDALVAYGRAHPEDLEAAAHLLTVSKAFERISDHATNIAQSVVFLIEGTDIRHPRARQAAARPGPPRALDPDADGRAA